MEGYTDRDLIPPDDEVCPECDGEGCILCEDDPGAKADWQYETIKDREAYDVQD